MSMKKMLLILATFVVASLTLAASASAYCGPEFTNKQEAVSYYHGAGAKLVPALTHELKKAKKLHGDQTFWALMNSPNTVVVMTPGGYKLTFNTSCNGSKIKPFNGLYFHSHKLVLAFRGQKSTKKVGSKHKVGTSTKVVNTTEEKVPQADGSVQVFKVETLAVTTTFHQKEKICYSYEPLEKAYCRNFVKGPAFKKCQTKVVTTHETKEETRHTLIRTEPAPPAPKEEPKSPPPHEKEPEIVCSNYAPNAVWSTAANACVVTVCGVTVVINGNNNTVNVENEACNEVHEKECECKEKEHEKPPPCEGCECKKECKPPPTCAEKGEIGTFPNCEKPEPPEIFAPEVNDVEEGEGYPNFKVGVKMWGSDTGTMTETSRYSGFGPHGEKPVETFTVAGFQEVTSRYQAPGEIPEKGYDEVTITVTDKQHPNLKTTVIVKITITPDDVNP